MEEEDAGNDSFSNVLGQWSKRASTDGSNPPDIARVGGRASSGRTVKYKGNPQEDLTSPKPNRKPNTLSTSPLPPSANLDSVNSSERKEEQLEELVSPRRRKPYEVLPEEDEVPQSPSVNRTSVAKVEENVVSPRRRKPYEVLPEEEEEEESPKPESIGRNSSSDSKERKEEDVVPSRASFRKPYDILPDEEEDELPKPMNITSGNKEREEEFVSPGRASVRKPYDILPDEEEDELPKPMNITGGSKEREEEFVSPGRASVRKPYDILPDEEEEAEFPKPKPQSEQQMSMNGSMEMAASDRMNDAASETAAKESVKVPTRRTSLHERISMFNNAHAPSDLPAKVGSPMFSPTGRTPPKPKPSTADSWIPGVPTDLSEPGTPVAVAKSLPNAPDLESPSAPDEGSETEPASVESPQKNEGGRMPRKNSSLIDRISRFQKESGPPPGLSVEVEGLLSPRYTQKPKKKLTAGVDKLPSFISPPRPSKKLSLPNKKLPSFINPQKPSKKLSLPDKDTKKQTESEPDSTFGEQNKQVVEAEERSQPAPPQKESIESPVEEKTQSVKTKTFVASSFRDRIVMFSKASAPPADLTRGRPDGFLSPKHMKRLVVVKEDAEMKKEEAIIIPAEPSPVKGPAPPIKPVENPAESTPSVSLDKAKAAESIVDQIGKFNTFHDRRNRLKATKSKVMGEKQKSATSKRNIFKAITAQVEDLSSFRIPRFPKELSDTKIIKKALKKNFVFDDLEEDDIERFIEAFQNVKIANGDTIIKQGDQGDYFYVVANGTVTFHVNNNKVGTAGQGNSFGHLALMFTCPRAATVKAAAQPTSLFRVDQKTFRYVMQSQTKKSLQEKEKLLRDIKFLSHLSTGDMQRLCSVMTPRLFSTGDCIVKKGEEGNSFYVIKEGRARVTDIFVGNTHYENVTLGPGDHFGEGALISSEPRAANVVALTEGTAFSIDRETFTKVLGDFSRLISKAQDRHRLEGIKLFVNADLTAADLNALATHIVDKEYDETEAIFYEDLDTRAAMYFVREGTVMLSTADGSRREEIGAGGYFGHEQLLVDSFGHQDASCMAPPDYTAQVTSSKCICGVLTLEECRSVFDTTSLGDGVFGGSSSQLLSKRASVRSTIHSSVTLDDLKRKSILGEGQFGEVWLVHSDLLGLNDVDSQQEFALKIQSKDDPVRGDSAVEAIKREMTVIQQLNHPFIIDLVESYETDESIYMLMEVVEGGELWSVIHKEDDDGNWTSGISEAQSKFYTLILADTLAYMHRQKFIFRDLKPENVLIDREGYPIIVDFGFAKLCTEKTFTFCGTPNYLAPEIVMNRGHGAGADHWALGIVTYEMITGENPFYFEEMDQMALFQAIVQEDYYPLPEKSSPEVKDLIKGLLEKEDAQRLGSLAGGEKDILKHGWFKDLDFTQVRNKEVKAPWIPNL